MAELFNTTRNNITMHIKKYVPQALKGVAHLIIIEDENYQRNELDDQGNPYPVLYMRLKK